MNRPERFVALALGACVALFAASPAALAQPAGTSASAGAGATIVAAAGIVVNRAELSFGRVVASARAAGTVAQTAAGNPARTGTGITLGSAATVSAAAFRVTGDGSATYAIMLPVRPETVAHDDGADGMSATVFSSLPDDTGLLDAGGAQTIYVGGTLDVAKCQRPGVYAGTFDVTVAYN